MDNNRQALVLGGSGLIGRLLIEQLRSSGLYSKITLLLRSPLTDLATDVEQRIESFDALIESAQVLSADDYFCCLGTTIKTVAGDKQAFYKIDHDYPLALAKLAQAGGAKRCFVVSALGANANSRVFYNRVKGELERDLKALKFDALHIYQPSLLLGERQHLQQPKRSGEVIGQALMPLLTPLLQGSLRKYRPTAATAVAEAMCMDAERQSQGLEIHQFD